ETCYVVPHRVDEIPIAVSEKREGNIDMEGLPITSFMHPFETERAGGVQLRQQFFGFFMGITSIRLNGRGYFGRMGVIYLVFGIGRQHGNRCLIALDKAIVLDQKTSVGAAV
ncbi:MAG: hypothetical protein P4L44_00005, partial [Oryzomonas sp.]